MAVAALNSKSITGFLTSGESVSVDNSDDVIENNVVSYYTTNGITPGTVGSETQQVIGQELIIPFLVE